MASLVTGHPPLKQDQRCVVAVMGEKSGGTRFTPLSDTEQHARSCLFVTIEAGNCRKRPDRRRLVGSSCRASSLAIRSRCLACEICMRMHERKR